MKTETTSPTIHYRGHDIRVFRYTDATHLWNAETRQTGASDNCRDWDDTYAEAETKEDAIERAKATIDNELDC